MGLFDFLARHILPSRRDYPLSIQSLVENEVYSYYGWTLQGVQDALSSFEQGQLLFGHSLFLAMSRDPIFAHGMNTRIMKMVGTKFHLEKPPNLPQYAFDRLVGHWPDAFPRQQLATSAMYRIPLGLAPGHVHWGLTQDAKMWLPTIKVLETGNLFYDTRDQNYKFNARQANRLDIKNDGNEWVLFENLSASRSFFTGIIRPLAVIWFTKQEAFRYWRAYNKAHGLPSKLIKVPYDQREAKDVKKLIAQAQDLISGSVMVMPQFPQGLPSFGMELIEAKGTTSYLTFPSLIKLCDDYITLLWLGAIDNTKSSAQGSKARATVHADVTHTYLQSDCECTQDALSIVLKRWAIMNNFPVTAAPIPVFEYQPPEDLLIMANVRQKIALASQEVSTFLTTLNKLQIPHDAGHICKQIGIQLLPQVDNKSKPL